MRTTRLSLLAASLGLALAACSGAASPSPSLAPASGAPPAASGVGPAASTAVPTDSAASASPASSAAAAGDAVTIANFAFAPANLTVKTGDTVTWTNGDDTQHTVTFDDGSQSSQHLSKGATFQRTFTTAGTFAYHCAIHPSMTATITVGG